MEPGSADRHQLALPHDGQLGRHGLDHLSPPRRAHRPEAFAKKSRSTSNRPISACSFSTSAAVDFAVCSASDRPENTAVRPSTACLFHSLTIVWWMECLVASCAVVRSPRSASRATLALNSAEYRLRLPVISIRPSQERAELNRLSDFRGPALYALAPATRAPLYSAAKAGLRSFTKALRRQLASTG